MLDLDRLGGDSGCIELEFLEREATPEPAMKLGIRLHLAGLSLSDTVSILEKLGVDRHRTTVHRWVQKADLQPLDGADPDHVAVDETVIQLNDERYWLYAAVDPDTNRLLHVRLFPTRTQALTEVFLPEPREKHLVDERSFSSMAHRGCRPPATATASDSNMLLMGIGTPSNVSSVN
jgi:transposase-like protein